MKRFARLTLFTLVCWILSFAASAAISFLRLHLAAAVEIPVHRTIFLREFVQKAQWALSFSFYFSVLLSVNYAQRNRVLPLAAFFAIGIICGGLTFAAAKGLEQARLMNAPPFMVTNPALGSAGLMLSQGNTVITLIDNPALNTGSRVIAAGGQPLVYQELPFDENNEVISLPPVKFRDDGRTIYNRVGRDFSLSAGEFTARFERGIIPFATWIVPVFMLLFALSYIFAVGAWPLANVLLCAVVYRAILLFEVFLNSPDIKTYLVDFVRGLMPASFIIPVIFAALAALFLLYDILMYFARERGKHG